jgi:CheY-like chemotaxis protein
MRPQVLIVDDEKTFADIIGELLTDEGYCVARASDGITAIQMLSSGRPALDVVLCDVVLPGLSGDRVAVEIRRLFPKRRLPIVLLSAGADPRVAVRDTWFMSKPIDCDDLLAVLKRLIGRRVAVATL